MTDHRVLWPHAGSPMNWANMMAGPVVFSGWATGPRATAGSALTGARLPACQSIVPQDSQGLAILGKLNVRGSRVAYGTDAGRGRSRDW